MLPPRRSTDLRDSVPPPSGGGDAAVVYDVQPIVVVVLAAPQGRPPGGSGPPPTARSPGSEEPTAVAGARAPATPGSGSGERVAAGSQPPPIPVGPPSPPPRATPSGPLPGSLPPPDPPTNLSLAAGPGSLTVTWSANPGDLATTQFFISWGCCSGYLGGLAVDREIRSYTITGLAPGIAHTVEVQVLGPNLDAALATRRAISGTPA